MIGTSWLGICEPQVYAVIGWSFVLLGSTHAQRHGSRVCSQSTPLPAAAAGRAPQSSSRGSLTCFGTTRRVSSDLGRLRASRQLATHTMGSLWSRRSRCEAARLQPLSYRATIEQAALFAAACGTVPPTTIRLSDAGCLTSPGASLSASNPRCTAAHGVHNTQQLKLCICAR